MRPILYFSQPAGLCRFPAASRRDTVGVLLAGPAAPLPARLHSRPRPAPLPTPTNASSRSLGPRQCAPACCSASSSGSSSAAETSGTRSETAGAMRVVLGSSSKWRAALVEKALPDGFSLVPGGLAPDIDEKALGDRSHGADATALVSAVASAKADALLTGLQSEHPRRADLVITADQVIVHDGVIREKPENKQQAKEFLQSYGNSGLPAMCVTGVVVTHISSGQRFSGVDIAKQYFKPVPDTVADSLIAKGDVMHCAGSFTVEDPLLKPYLGPREGEIESVEGMPISLTRDLLLKAAASARP